MKTNTGTRSSAEARARGARVLLGPPGLFLGLTLAAIVAGVWIARSADAAATAGPRPAATARR